MLPIRHFSDLYRFMDNPYDLLKAPFYIMALYKSEHNVFREFIMSQFIKIHHQTQDIAFIVCDTPPEGWNEREDAQYYEKLVGKDYKPLLDDYEINIIAKYMDVPINALPCLVFFDDILKHTFNCFSFAGKTMTSIESFFETLLEIAAMYSYQGKNFVNTMIKLRHQFPDFNVFLDWDETNRIPNRVSNARDDIYYYRSPEGKNKPNKKPRKLSPLQIAKQCCQARAQQIWAKNPDISITAMTERSEVLFCFDEYNTRQVKPRTIHYWINELAPPEVRKSGRRPNKR